jgi:hypothetical protein
MLIRQTNMCKLEHSFGRMRFLVFIFSRVDFLQKVLIKIRIRQCYLKHFSSCFLLSQTRSLCQRPCAAKCSSMAFFISSLMPAVLLQLAKASMVCTGVVAAVTKTVCAGLAAFSTTPLIW